MNGGDVHFSTLDGLVYTFNAGGDFNYLENNLFNIHVRMKMSSKTASVLVALAFYDKQTQNTLEMGKNAFCEDKNRNRTLWKIPEILDFADKKSSMSQC